MAEEHAALSCRVGSRRCSLGSLSLTGPYRELETPSFWFRALTCRCVKLLAWLWLLWHRHLVNFVSYPPRLRGLKPSLIVEACDGNKGRGPQGTSPSSSFLLAPFPPLALAEELNQDISGEGKD
ncbi:hypothetical protein CP532_6753 [Ophiocordyceps camponoti-leonardi (nom. inval.)]|nr:hypothetical protein CP532_6753 [Ophiocordyceps camponoti-leonardi (nom. inval.)]